ncbi:hypothetical protein PRIPAC_78316 [Pristionchus pacificus]|uniref:G protein-coupled receptor n=1 Tax=Pristionchus pacificus TaxID=54126 RepID=A0A2A6CQQ0_PRIPA|nr:hypothetical protein PRIPAC_78316 [Pristionchus pacificus]|eukprot:PDM80416.1 G protein-coupled receptor [Pristionchus pacificus]
MIIFSPEHSQFENTRFLNCYFNYGPDSETEEYVQPFLVDEFPVDGMEFIGALYYNDEGKFRTRAFLATMGFNTIMSVCMSDILMYSFTIVFHFRSAPVKWSRKTKALQLQLFRTLVAQTTIPMIFVYFPCAGIINLPMLGFRLNVFPNLVSASLTLFPLIDAFIITFGVRTYRYPSTSNAREIKLHTNYSMLRHHEVYRRTVLLLFIRPVPNMITAGAMSNAQT